MEGVAIPGVVAESFNSNGMAAKVPNHTVTGNQDVTGGGSNTSTRENENPGALAGASGANWKSVGDLSKPYLKRAESATAFANRLQTGADPMKGSAIKAKGNQ